MDRNGTRLGAQIDESQNRPVAVFGRLPRIEEEIRIIDSKKACLISIERPRQIECLVLRADFVVLQWCRFLPTHAAEHSCIRACRAGDDVTEAEVSALRGTIVGVPVVVHYVGEYVPR